MSHPRRPGRTRPAAALFLAAACVLPTLAVASPASLAAQESLSLGTIDFPNSGAAQAQNDFIQGVLLLHSFEYGDAAEAFRRARAVDPDFALAYWGEAMTHNHPLWQQQDREAAREILEAYGGTPGTEREAMYLEAVATLYGQGSKTERDEAYMRAMRRLSEAWPDDHEARAFYALSILGLSDGVRDFANYMRAAATAQPVFEANPEHPGAAHYIIHAFDDPIHAPLGLPAARSYGAIAPDAGHAQHMTSHIFLAMGMWDDVVRANVNATRVADRNQLRRAPDRPVVRCGHYPYWLQYGHLMREEWDRAAEIMDGCQANQAEPDRDVSGYYVSLRGRQILDSGDWDAVDRWTWDFAPDHEDALTYHFVDAFADWKRGDPSRARRMLGHLAGGRELEPRDDIVRLELAGMVALADGDAESAVEHLEAAAALEESLPLEFGPPASVKPPHELLGEILLEVGRPADAVEAFQGSLALTPRRTPSLRGLGTAAREAGMDALARDVHARVREIVR